MNITVQMEKYDPAVVEADIQNLDLELADEDGVNTTLVNSGAAERAETLRKFIAENKDRITDQHARMLNRVRTLHSLVKTNQALEAADSDYKALAESEDAQLVAQLLSELNAMSQQYHDLLLDTGRAGRPPLF